jgi:hypothetical protein
MILESGIEKIVYGRIDIIASQHIENIEHHYHRLSKPLQEDDCLPYVFQKL